MLSLRLGGDSSGEGLNSTTSNKSSNNKRKEMGMWLSLMPPGSHSCVLCDKSFNSLQAIEGYQNSHQTLQFQVQMHNLYLKMIEEEKKKKKNKRRGKSTNNNLSCKVILPNQVVANDDDQSGIDLDLHLGVVPSEKVVDFYEFIPIKRMKC